MIDKVTAIEERYEELNRLLNEVGEDYQRAVELAKERAELEPIVQKAQQYRSVQEQIEQARSLANEHDEELRQLAEADLDSLLPQEEHPSFACCWRPRIPATSAT